ncbi:gluconate 2-dehydrogenase subunit 3 family protein [Sporosarcina sp. Marseille-Q4063]|uniref:gluconate 2-dehydrogenase subunit 3 family protein n=1 Tax=Sporosarcina sp. Marseille-Q4063 TaxID=2810514 RepID=UPI001BAFE023|nr:gluconate 2-dehydrogenase subunit 3 family protein [Sporosarcina sp. Marseille-Q4063]QUW22962.1 gluconate 2-dehydrogenase subunit 3 family protein [Sporosarcina sp. Marseille-Q4063]
MTEPRKPDSNSQGMSRRNFLKNTGLVAGGLVGGSLFGGLITNQTQKDNKNTTSDTGGNKSFEARIFFSRNEDFDTLSAATERLFPETDVGPGAIALGVPYFIDRQLAGEWGTNAHDYMTGPFPQIAEVEKYVEEDTNQNEGGPESEVRVPAPTPRYQTRMTRAALFMEGVHALQKTAEEKFDERFKDLEPDQQDEILGMFDNNEAEVKGVSSNTFFNLLLGTTIEGAYADPAYGGNRNMEGWKMKEFPGPRMSWLQDIEKEDFIVMKPESLRNYQGHN